MNQKFEPAAPFGNFSTTLKAESSHHNIHDRSVYRSVKMVIQLVALDNRVNEYIIQGTTLHIVESHRLSHSTTRLHEKL